MKIRDCRHVNQKAGIFGAEALEKLERAELTDHATPVKGEPKFS